MTHSIRKFLVIYLLLAMTLTTLLTAAGNYYLDRKDINKQMDLSLSEASYSLQALLGKEFHLRDLKKLQAQLNAIPVKAKQHYLKQHKTEIERTRHQYQFQIYSNDKNKNLVLRSSYAPKKRLSDGKEGFKDITLNKTRWRTFTKYDSTLNLNLTIAENYTLRNKMTAQLIKEDIYMMLLVYPFVGLLIWFITTLALRSIRKVTDEVAHRLPNYLDPVDSTSVPTEIKPLVIELNHLFERLQKALEREKRFAGDAAHELRTPLAALRTQAEVALEIKDKKTRNKQLRNVIEAVDRSTHIVQQLLILSRLVPEAHIMKEATQLDLSTLAAEVTAQLAPKALNKNIDIELLTNHTKKHLVFGNRTALNILIRNLVDNAIRYTAKDGKVTISVSSAPPPIQNVLQESPSNEVISKKQRTNASLSKQKSDHQEVILRVIDNGPGIPKELRSRVFERFYRVLGSKAAGSGLGLAITQQIAELHNAELKLASGPNGKGLEVTVVFTG